VKSYTLTLEGSKVLVIKAKITDKFLALGAFANQKLNYFLIPLPCQPNHSLV